MQTLNSTLFFLSNAMLIPVIVSLLLFFLQSLLLVGRFFGFAVSRIRSRASLKKFLEAGREDDFTKEELLSHLRGNSLREHYIKKMINNCDSISKRNKLVADFELEAESEREKSRILMRIGPMLGLMGTLIPMGPALAGLASGNLGMMAQNMQVAFATTVIGVFCGIVGFVLNAVKKRWFAEDIVNLNYIRGVFYGEE